MKIQRQLLSFFALFVILCLIGSPAHAEPPAGGKPSKLMEDLKNALEDFFGKHRNIWKPPGRDRLDKLGRPLDLLRVDAGSPLNLDRHGPWGPYFHLHLSGLRDYHDIVFWWARPYRDPDFNKTLWWRQHLPNPSAAPPPILKERIIPEVNRFIIDEYPNLTKPLTVEEFKEKPDLARRKKAFLAMGFIFAFSQMYDSAQAGDIDGVLEAAWDLSPAEISPWEVARAHKEATLNCETNEQKAMGTLMTPAVMIGRQGEGIGCLIATGVECLFGGLAPAGSKPLPGVWSPWR